ncbi:transcriptional regulator with XRE-family HTH domain [Geothermobacter ehrlichii]|uniref:Transcriptional regulator with XRE-family HTH domain n=1 Tax=Geothermobacter ehrlichii TaxID=213224 RepID=A0A5D3WIR4_9BACT|nr:helix-turn-helix transcriptional regulator [Geothermobacter ehrlichii]TYO98769.1 transcriptional regulator with XRE-family HTH domain [Geothermobacter ehrlichii]
MAMQLPPTVSIDGRTIRRVREEKRLTQLYVAKVVGVTTDTISRWENNRYPNIKRDNALALAEALEVPVEMLLRRDEGDDTEAGATGDVRRRRIALTVFLLASLLSAVGLFFLMGRQPDRVRILAFRLLPRYAAPGSVIPVRVAIDRKLDGRGYILREHFPRGWKLIEANPPASSLDNINGTARWIVKPGEKRERIVYLLRVVADSAVNSTVKFGGEVVIKGEAGEGEARVGGKEKVEVAPFLWPDQDGNLVIDDAEILAASDVFDEMKGVHLDWNFLESVWDAGSYRWLSKKKVFRPVKRAETYHQHPE